MRDLIKLWLTLCTRPLLISASFAIRVPLNYTGRHILYEPQ